MVSPRELHEIEHGRKLASSDPESEWGWGSPAGQIRARRRIQYIMAGARLKPGMRILEIGCGTGLFTSFLAEQDIHILAVDISEDLIARAKQRGLPAGRVEFACMPFESSGFAGPFDAVVGSSVLHHLDIKPALLRLYQVLKPGGRMSFAEPNMMNPQIYVERHFRQFFPAVSADETAFTKRQIQTLLSNSGFTDAIALPFDFLHPMTPPALIPFVSRCGWLAERTPLLREIAGSLHITGQRPSPS